MTTAKPMLMFVHGLLSTPLDFSDQVAAMPDDLQGTAPWLRGARPGAKGETFDLVSAAADLAMTIELSGAPRTTCFGVGEGALVCLEIASSRPELPVDLVLVGPALAASAGARTQRRLTSLVPRRMLAARGVDKRRALDGLAEIADADLWGRVSELRSRVLLLVGEKDRAARAAAEAFTARATAADVRTCVVPGAGASPHTQRPQESNAALYDFIGVTPRR
ncbi:alpha/beta fold hydrolase [Mobilicoccus pelagius]|uniref:AB hydrolase-1 domain-containing protein n=1 Tax=Mobilicoccus pelagius NBRC 104925 TaxID=1089455 RepID=H5USJ0_9MICO|nr:alpha/beta hydrolase [Mobilicoccus pelagius]GAB48698.1 hypothetical protein MOPEL_078_00870 [Mobilicoccus pelagius NBRC 104925]